MTLRGLSLVSSLLTGKNMEELSTKLLEVGDLYAEDPDSLKSELHSWYVKWKDQETKHGFSSLPTSLHHTLPHVSSLYPNIKAHLLVLCTLPVTSCVVLSIQPLPG